MAKTKKSSTTKSGTQATNPTKQTTPQKQTMKTAAGEDVSKPLAEDTSTGDLLQESTTNQEAATSISKGELEGHTDAISSADKPSKGKINTKTVEISKVFENVMQEAETVSTKMQGQRYSLGSVSFSIKSHIKEEDGKLKMQLIDAGSVAAGVTGGAVSAVNIQLDINEASYQPGEIPAPNVIDLTETAARKRLRTYGLKLETIYQKVAKDDLNAGKAIRQLPAAGEGLPSGGVVKVIFLKNN